MSYASDMKKELTLIEITKDREFLSELSALIKMNGVLNISNGRLSLSFQTENASIARRMFSLIKFFYDVHVNISVRKKLKLKKNNVYICRLDQNVKEILTDLYNLILDKEVGIKERELYKKAILLIEKENEYYEAVLFQLVPALAYLARQESISSNGCIFMTKISRFTNNSIGFYLFDSILKK